MPWTQHHKKTLIVNQFYFKGEEGPVDEFDIHYRLLYRDIPFYLKPFRYLHQLLKFPKFSYWYTQDWERVFKGYELIVLHDADPLHNNYFISKIEKHADPSAKLILYYWNSVYGLDALKFDKTRWEVLTFDYKDAQENGLRYVGGFYSAQKIKPRKEQYDLFFIGINKGRFGFLENLRAKMEAAGLKPLFMMVSPAYRFRKDRSKGLPYREVLEKVAESKAILEINKEAQFGLTLRPYEALFYGKKLVTTNRNIHRYNFYHPQNIMVVDDETAGEAIREFIGLPFVPYDGKFTDQYSVSSWLRRVDGTETETDVQ